MRARITAIVLATLLAACGSDGRLTHAELVERADAVCAEALDRIRELGADLPEVDAASVEAWTDVLGQTLPILEGMIADLRDLEPPPSDAEGYAALLVAYDREAEALAEVLAAAEAGDADAMSTPSEDATFATIDADHVAGRLGLDGCRLIVQEQSGTS